ncbi:molybdenum ABC transporter permease [Candidatus Bathyarchaeota archaeon]|nr:MAG: molybdenum ABC transporter permease [Candidatus Bathyarchaeota archaeon]
MSLIKNRSPFVALSAVLGVFMLIFLLLPIFNTVSTSANRLGEAVVDVDTGSAILTSFYAAFLATLITFIFGTPLAYILARYDFKGKTFIDAAIDLPILIPHNAAGISLLMLLGPKSLLGSAFSGIGLSFVDTLFGVVAAMTFVSSPFMIRSAEEAFKSVNPGLEKVARSLGASSFGAFANVTFPLAFRGILTGCLLTWARSVSEFGAVIVLAFYPKTAAVHLYEVFVNWGLNAATPITALLIITAVGIFALVKLISAKPLKPVYSRQES